MKRGIDLEKPLECPRPRTSSKGQNDALCTPSPCRAKKSVSVKKKSVSINYKPAAPAEPRSYLRLVDFVYHSTPGSRKG